MEKKKFKLGLLPKLLIAIVLGIIIGQFFPVWFCRVVVTASSIFSSFLKFIIPLMIVAYVTMGIADLKSGAGKLLLITVALAYGSTLIAGSASYLVSASLFPSFMSEGALEQIAATADNSLASYISISIPPLLDTLSAVVLAFVLGLCMSTLRGKTIGDTLYNGMKDFSGIIDQVLHSVIIPLLPFYIFGIFLSMTQSGQVSGILGIFLKLIVIIFVMTVVLLLIQFSIAGLVARQNPLKMLRTMMTAYMTALGTQSSAATIPVTLAQTVKIGVRPEVAGFVVPLCATIHLSGSMMKIVACSLAVMMLSGLDVAMGTYSGFILLLGITMIAAPGVPGGAIMAAIGLLESMLGFDENMIGLMIATYIAMDSFGTATNVTGDGAIAVIVNAIDSRMIRREKR